MIIKKKLILSPRNLANPLYLTYPRIKEFRKKVSSNLDENEIKKIVELLEKVAFNMEN